MSQAKMHAPERSLRASARTESLGGSLRTLRETTFSRLSFSGMSPRVSVTEVTETLAQSRSARRMSQAGQRSFDGDRTVMITGFKETTKWRHVEGWVTQFCGEVDQYEVVTNPGNTAFVVMFKDVDAVENALLLTGSQLMRRTVTIQPVKVQSKNITVADVKDKFAGKFEDILAKDVEKVPKKPKKSKAGRRREDEAFEEMLTDAVTKYSKLSLKEQINLMGVACLGAAGAYYLATKKERTIKRHAETGMDMILMEMGKLGIN